MAKITNGRVVAEVPDNKADHYCLFLGYKRVPEPRCEDETEEELPIPKPRRGRPPKKAS